MNIDNVEALLHALLSAGVMMLIGGFLIFMGARIWLWAHRAKKGEYTKLWPERMYSPEFNIAYCKFMFYLATVAAIDTVIFDLLLDPFDWHVIIGLAWFAAFVRWGLVAKREQELEEAKLNDGNTQQR